jgi:hypothetical protein
MGRLLRQPELRTQSIDCGSRLQSMMGWPAAASAIAGTILQTASPAHSPRATRLAVVGVLSSSSTGPAASTLRMLQSASYRTDFFDPHSRDIHGLSAHLLPGNRIIPAEVVRCALLKPSYRRALFVLAGSDEYVEVLKQLLATRLGCQVPRWVYLEDLDLARVLTALRGDEFRQAAQRVTFRSRDPWVHRTLRETPGIESSVKFLVETAQIDGFAVHSQACRALVEECLQGAARQVPVEMISDILGRGPAVDSPTASEIGPLLFDSGSSSLLSDISSADRCA